MIYAQIIGSGSEYHLYDKTIPSLYGFDKYSYDHILDCINYIGFDFHKYIEVLNHHIQNKYNRNFNNCYLVTSYLFILLLLL